MILSRILYDIITFDIDAINNIRSLSVILASSQYSLRRQLQLHSIEVSWVRVAEVRRTSLSVCFVVDAIPYDLVISPCSYTSAESEYQFTIKCFSQQLQHLVALFVVWQICSPMSTWKRDVASLARKHAVIDHYSANCFVASAMHKFVNKTVHFAWGLISDHLAKNSKTDWTSYPILITFQTHEARFVKKVAAGKGNNIIIRLFNKLALVIGGLLVLELADAAFVFRGFFSSQREHEAGKVGVRNSHMYFFVYLLLLFLEQLEQTLDLRVESMV